MTALLHQRTVTAGSRLGVRSLMSGVFISYRRSDTGPWAGRLFDHLSRKFGKGQVFMDIEGGIPRGMNFASVLEKALSDCDTLLVLIGPTWLTCQRSDGRRRLDVADDWVRYEVTTAIKRGVAVMPVLLGKASIPKRTDLPDDLRPFVGQQYAEVSDTRWEYDVGEMVKDLLKLVPGLQGVVDDMASADTGIRLLKDLISTVPAVGDAVSRSKEVIENTSRQVGKLELFKTIHDSLHRIEFECLRTMQAGGLGGSMRPIKLNFTSAATRMSRAIDADSSESALRDSLQAELTDAAEAFKRLVEAPGKDTFENVVGELNMLLSRFLPRLDRLISEAARGLSLDRLVDLMNQVRSKLRTPSSPGDTELVPFIQGIDALQRLRDELTRRVAEHARLQNLDVDLRAACVGGMGMAIANQWKMIRLSRAEIRPPFSPEMEAASEELGALESDIETALKRGQEAEARDILGAYFGAVSSVFRGVDESLKEFCLRLAAVSQPLQTILQML